MVIDYERWLEFSGDRRSALDSFAGAPDLSSLELERDATPVAPVDLE